MRQQEKEPVLKFTKEQEGGLLPALKKFLEDELDAEVSGLQCKMLLRYITNNLGMYYYNQGIEDAATLMAQRVDDLYVLLRDE